ncbi:MAG TPA: hypothetical protein VFI56_06220 [Vicinamibacterales bacterium]|nr:hypothetical protein [Vicinamibacterales bacterium]
MSPVAALVCAVLAVTHLALGWRLGFHSPSAYLISWIFFALAGLPAWRLARYLTPSSSVLDRGIRTAVLSFAAIAFAGLTLGGLHLIGTLAYLCLFAAAAIASRFLEVNDVPAEPPTLAPIPVVVVLVPLVAFVVAVGVLRSPLTLYDGLSYHLVFPARWLQDSALSIIQTPFSDPAQAYQPGNGELFFLWLMLPFHGDLLARIGQLPFLLLAGIALFAIARRSGAAPQHAAYAPMFLFLARPIVEQAVGADVDLVCAAMFVTSLYLGIVAVDSDGTSDWALWGVALGLYAGSKYLALVYLGVLLLLPLVHGIRRKALWALPGLALFGLPWYIRNWVVAGSPLYPSSLGVLGFVVAPGAFSREAMNNSVFHVTSLRLFPAIAAHGFGAAYALVWLPGAVLGIASLAAHRRWWPAGFVALVPVLIFPLFWLVLPDNADSRFLLPAVTVASVLPAFAFGANRGWNGFLHAAYILAAAWLIVGVQRQIPATLPWFMGDWLALDGIVAPDSLGIFAAGVVATLCIALLAARLRLSSWWMTAAVCAGAVGLTFGWLLPKPADSLALLSLSPTYVRAGMITGWEWTAAHVSDSVVANTGNNVPYPLFGEHLTNRVEYINIDRHTNWRFHDYARTRTRNILAEHPFARPSGQLMPLVQGTTPQASRPRFERWEGDRDAWVANLRVAGVTHLFVTVLSAYELGFSWHNEGGFPIEDAWARDDPAQFRLLYENGQVRLYSVAQP